jgi:uncharacterized protein YidB (DUF937 family)
MVPRERDATLPLPPRARLIRNNQEDAMGILDTLMKNPQMIGDVAKFAKDNPQLAKAAMSFLSSSGGSNAGSGGLGSVLGALQSGGLGDVVSSWVGTGANKSISPDQLQKALGSERVQQFAKQAGVSGKEASSALAAMLPGLVDKLSPDGKMPDASGLDGMIGKLLGGRG